MYICICNAINDIKIKEVINENTSGNFCEFYVQCSQGEKPQCGKCIEEMKRLYDEH
jgi:bacterioferritin-associated ferredoxin